MTTGRDRESAPVVAAGLYDNSNRPVVTGLFGLNCASSLIANDDFDSRRWLPQWIDNLDDHSAIADRAEHGLEM